MDESEGESPLPRFSSGVDEALTSLPYPIRTSDDEALSCPPNRSRTSSFARIASDRWMKLTNAHSWSKTTLGRIRIFDQKLTHLLLQ